MGMTSTAWRKYVYHLKLKWYGCLYHTVVLVYLYYVALYINLGAEKKAHLSHLFLRVLRVSVVAYPSYGHAMRT
jgi:hypothetical protein